MSFTESLEELRLLLPVIQEIYYRGGHEGMSVVSTPAEYKLEANPFIQRRLAEFSLIAPVDPLAAARRALLEERPERILLAGSSALSQQLRAWAAELGIGVGFHATPAPVGRPLSAGPRLTPDHIRATLEAERQIRVPVNLNTGGPTYRYRDYDNEFARGPADLDLRAVLKGHFDTWSVTIDDARSGTAGPGPVEAPDGRHPQFHVRLDTPPANWLQRFSCEGARPLRFVFLDSQNIAGSVLNHCLAVNRYTPHKALAVSTVRHPFISYPQEDCRAEYCDQGLTAGLRQELEEADVFVFFEDDDETNPAWPFALGPFLDGKAIMHIYIGFRVHADVVRMQRPGRTILTPLPHLLRMFPTAHFYAGFPPATLDDVELRPALSASDGILRVLQTPSLPHKTTHRYYYHKDTDSYLEAAQALRARHPEWQFWQLGGLPHRQILEARLDCDLTFNQLRGYHGLSGDEAMYLERPMIQAFDQFNINRHREFWGLDTNFPWINSTPATLAEDIEALLLDPQERLRRGRDGRQFMLDYFSPQAGIQPLVWYAQEAIAQKERSS